MPSTRRIEQKLAGLSVFNPTKRKFLARVDYYGQTVEIDDQGRLLIPDLLRKTAGLEGEVELIAFPGGEISVNTGKIRYFELRPARAYAPVAER